MIDSANDRRLADLFRLVAQRKREWEAVSASSPAIEALRQLQQPWESSPLARRVREIQESEARVRERIAEVVHGFEQVNSQWRQSFEAIRTALKQWQPALDAINEGLRHVPDWWSELNERIDSALDRAGDRGWFFQPEFDLALLLRAHGCAADDGLDLLLEAAVADCVDEIEARLCATCPDRVDVLREAFSLFREARYLAAIPLLLASADGIAQQVSGQHAFNLKSRKPRLAAWINTQEYQGLVYSAARQLVRAHPFATKFAGIPSRHEILHGADVAYGTKRNALRTISFIGSLTWILIDVRAEETEDTEEDA